ncbi:peptide deformylase [Patescibacteria group bacterium]|nr:peptide deformylase [Candidatus Falkowbacteria bacterium]MBU3905852.1 peptide deformylase [Patescibacteria group bacterium]MBU4015264.1 peptide deformylase [Patescibacteria group bacterium]MBU4027201.1 peptide deformylase [Patescibacteria group bacterium]MBU4073380.1 peptide deformylase [Patescibacteria group bacterium]
MSNAKILPILINHNPILRKKSTQIRRDEIKTKEFQRLCSDMAKTMEEKDGAGLAAPQIGKNIRLVVVRTENSAVCMINPKIIKKSWAKECGEEGCLSVPDVFGKVKRHKKIICKYLDKKGKEIKIEAEGLMARVIQHEIDHLDGVLFIDKARDIKKLT